jgi:SAM-dependent methyltransferase
VLPLAALDWPPAALVFVQGGLALLLSRRLNLPTWWQAINALFCPLLWLATRAEIDPLWYLAGFIVLALTSLGSVMTRVPLFLSSRQAVAAVAARAPRGGRVLDLGCGLGGWLAALHGVRPDLALAGVEMAPFNWLAARLRLGARADVRLGSLWDADLADYDVVYAYLSPAPMARLWQKVEREMRPGSLFISNTFAVPGREPDETVDLNDLSQARLLIWRR